jgi:acetolactate synthase-1/2/3 large subunit
MEGELPGSRDNMIQFIQNVTDQGNLVREYIKHYMELRSGVNTQQAVYRALQLANSNPPGPVYLTAPREMLEEDGRDLGDVPKGWGAVEPLAMAEGVLKKLTTALLCAKKPIVVTSYLGKQEESVGELVKFCETLGVGVVESPPSYMNFPGDHPLHLGIDVGAQLAQSDLALIIDNDIPWIPAMAKAPEDCRVFYLDMDPVKDDIPLWNYPAEMYIRADSLVALRQLNEEIAAHAIGQADQTMIKERKIRYAAQHDEMKAGQNAMERPGEKITSPFLLATLRELIDDDTILLNESISNCPFVEMLLPRNKPGTRYHSGGSSLGWHGGAAIGAKLAKPDRDIIALTGDGSYLFSIPSVVYWVARKYKTPFMTIIFNNNGWTAPKMATVGQHPEGYAATTQTFWTEFEPAPRYDLIAEAAGDAYGAMVEDPKDLKRVLEEGLAAIRSGRCAVINVAIAPMPMGPPPGAKRQDERKATEQTT